MGLMDLAYSMYESRLSRALPRERMPQHIGVVVDGNRRWAKLAGTPTADGHLAGAHKIVEFIDWCAELGIPTVTLYMLSTDNMNRSAAELDQLMEIIGDTLDRLAESRPGGRPVRVHPVGALELLPEPLAARLRQLGERNAAADEAEDAAEPADDDAETVTTRTGSIRRIVRRSRERSPAVHVNVAVGYGGRQEIVDAVKELLREADSQGRGLEEVAEELTPGAISQWLYTRGQPDPDLIIRTSGEQRLSGFLMWQSAYSEFYFCEALWPDFRRVDFVRALRDYAQRQRRFGG
ncbi:polyprenyl diphosphate synthase [Nesterenkonia xinjiangensis]|uniref:Isoprenyl transferase n=1 Tax=Nesterenkonia xinjiangensis TaxID=225327 RepID=A0A7Z0K814_9MICC|nr:polyprenyl diphosphate synthase [Nesterenkonia xinjiangensis]NYJ77074.1 short-chain Z-isoprenyl diphosphate synthase [Nesterenkonia xinjiangensis]